MAKLKKIGYGYVFLLFFVLSLTSASYRLEIDPPMENENNSLDLEAPNLRTSDYWDDVSHIWVDGNWSDAATLDWIQDGAGTWNDPYRIENLTMNVGNTGSGIYIANTTEYFIIKNCTIYLSGTAPYDAAIRLFNATNGIIESCDLNNNWMGINLDESDNITIRDNNIYENIQMGIRVYKSDENRIYDNLVTDDGIYGIFLNAGADENRIYENTITKNTGTTYGYGIFFSASCKRNTIHSNEISQNKQGIRLRQYCSDNVFTENNLKGNSLYGVVLFNNSGYLCENNTFLKNYFETTGGVNVVDNGTDNKWDNGEIGNYWHDYEGKDEDDDGIGDDPYAISGTANAIDNYPIWDDGDEKKEKDDTDDEGPAIPGFPFGFLMGIMSLSVLGLIMLRKFKK